MNKPEQWLGDLARNGNVRERVLAEFGDWAPSLTALITDSEKPPVLRPIHALPSEHRWGRMPGVTLLGDAAHLMSPFAGEGANLAMFDGAELGKAIAAKAGDLEVAIQNYEEEMFSRSAAAATEAARNLQVMFDTDAPQSLLGLFANYTSAT